MTMQKLLFLVILLNFTHWGSLSAQDLHIIIFADTENPSTGIAQGIGRNVKAIEDIASGIAKNVPIQATFKHFFTGKDFLKSNWENLPKKLQTGPRDIILFYFCGHGYYTEAREEYPRLILTSTDIQIGKTPSRFITNHSVSLKDVHDRLNELPHKLLVVIGENCYEKISLESEYVSMGLIKTSAYQSLFLYPKGSMIIMACAKNEVAYVDNELGGAFNKAFRESFHDLVRSESYTNWELLKDRTVRATQREVAGKGVKQTPVFRFFWE